MVSWERSDNNHISNTKFYYDRFSTSDPNLRGMGWFRIQLLLEDNSWFKVFNVPKNNQFSNGSTQWHLFDLDISQDNNGVKFIYDQITTAHSDMCFSNITINNSVFWMDNSNYFRDLFESILDYRKIVLLRFSVQNDKKLLHEISSSERDKNRLNLEFKNILIEQNEEYIDFNKNEEESIIEKILNK